jgi:hypothetical protein
VALRHQGRRPVLDPYHAFIAGFGFTPPHSLRRHGFRPSTALAAARNVTVRDGIVTGFKLDGILGGYAWTVENMQVTQNGAVGANLSNYSRVTNSTVTENGGIGVYCSYACHIQGSVIAENGTDGVNIFYSATVLGNTITGNNGYGISAQNVQGYRTGYGNNLIDSNGNGSVYGGSSLLPLHPNACDPACP